MPSHLKILNIKLGVLSVRIFRVQRSQLHTLIKFSNGNQPINKLAPLSKRVQNNLKRTMMSTHKIDVIIYLPASQNLVNHAHLRGQFFDSLNPVLLNLEKRNKKNTQLTLKCNIHIVNHDHTKDMRYADKFTLEEKKACDEYSRTLVQLWNKITAYKEHLTIDKQDAFRFYGLCSPLINTLLSADEYQIHKNYTRYFEFLLHLVIHKTISPNGIKVTLKHKVKLHTKMSKTLSSLKKKAGVILIEPGATFSTFRRREFIPEVITNTQKIVNLRIIVIMPITINFDAIYHIRQHFLERFDTIVNSLSSSEKTIINIDLSIITDNKNARYPIQYSHTEKEFYQSFHEHLLATFKMANSPIITNLFAKTYVPDYLILPFLNKLLFLTGLYLEEEVVNYDNIFKLLLVRYERSCYKHLEINIISPIKVYSTKGPDENIIKKLLDVKKTIKDQNNLLVIRSYSDACYWF